jgi:hypothetical protein
VPRMPICFWLNITTYICKSCIVIYTVGKEKRQMNWRGKLLSRQEFSRHAGAKP